MKYTVKYTKPQPTDYMRTPDCCVRYMVQMAKKQGKSKSYYLHSQDGKINSIYNRTIYTLKSDQQPQ